MKANRLPFPDTFAQAYSDRLTVQIAEEIRQLGPIPFERYMSLALYAPGLGYYSAGSQKLGTSGDFVTAPEISPLFSQCVARQCIQVLSELSSGHIFELGAGSGKMALDVLQALEREDRLPLHYYILEVSADLRDRQRRLFQEKAPQYLSCVTWLDRLPSQPMDGVIIANEVMDAMPVHKFKIENTIKEYYVDFMEGEFIWHVDEPSTKELVECVGRLNTAFESGYESEINLQLPSWIRSLSNCLQRGLILLMDYGFPRHEYYHPDRRQGTVMCHYRHRAHADPLVLTGLQDITAHVDFTCVAEAAKQSDLDVVGFTHQAAFLLNCGLIDLAPPAEDVVIAFRTAQEIKRLTLPSEMGELFKMIALVRGIDMPLIGFSDFNQVERL